MMRIILSRKGFDSSYGRVASPIFDDGRMCSLPIPVVQNDGICYGEIFYGQSELSSIVENLTKNKITKESYAHLDPDLVKESRNRTLGSDWLPAFGQSGAAASHLKNKGVNIGDLFLFFGWFREVEFNQSMYSYNRSARDQHVIFGWLQIGEIYDVNDTSNIPNWLCEHPHVMGESINKNQRKSNTIYVASPKLSIAGLQDYSGGGIFRNFDDCRLLTSKSLNKEIREDNLQRSYWKLPAWIKERGLSYHGNDNRWEVNGNSAYLQTVGKGQEFVVNCDDSEQEAINWIKGLFQNADT